MTEQLQPYQLELLERSRIYADGTPIGELLSISFAVNLEQISDAMRRVGEAAELAAASARELHFQLHFSRGPMMRRFLHPHHGFTGHRHRGTRAWARRYAHR